MTRLLIVEDEEIRREFLDLSLKGKGYDLIFANDGVEGLAALIRSGDVDIIILDKNMPRMNGYEFSKTLKTEDAYKPWSHIPIIGYGNFENAQDSKYLVARQQKVDGIDELLYSIQACEKNIGDRVQ